LYTHWASRAHLIVIVEDLLTVFVLVLLPVLVGQNQASSAGEVLLSKSDFSSRAASEALPMRDAFAVLFFVSMGMLFDPARLMSDVS
jgi:predicted Kef-type K+ transport protein